MGGEGKTNFWSFDHSPMTLARGGKQMGLCAAFGVENILIAPFAFKYYYFFSTAGFLSISSIASQCQRTDPREVSVMTLGRQKISVREHVEEMRTWWLWSKISISTAASQITGEGTLNIVVSRPIPLGYKLWGNLLSRDLSLMVGKKLREHETTLEYFKPSVECFTGFDRRAVRLFCGQFFCRIFIAFPSSLPYTVLLKS